ncbi:hypothetical protein H0H81_012199 [Sphagnurus paluster]|uniref:L-tryptophan decarboxylase PsiD-like domain-containing protein n=1 Tax=Sphagnurus paluster TaxID=117069 RepID=A0A9P7K3A2_9AGAR|nr:hypothetical protein H0H81_012199 [Sphagnurus paluster]
MSAAAQTVPALRDDQYASSPFNSVPILMSVGGWIPDGPDQLNSWLEKKLEELEREPMSGRQDKSIEDFREFIEKDPQVFMGFDLIFENVPEKDPLGRPQVKDYDTMLRLFNRFIKQAPKFDNSILVFLPFTAVLQWPMVMTNGLNILTNPQVNDHFRRIFKVWSEFLESPDSRYVLTEDDGGWLGPVAMQHMPNFKETFICNPDEPHWGFQSWDGFFTRHMHDGARPVTSPDDPAIITSACESKVLRIAYNVQERDRFWIKSQPYSLTHMLNNHPEAKSFAGGTVYQAFLSPFYYHRWSSPVDGVIEKVEVVQGTYFSTGPFKEPLPVDIWEGQHPFLSQVATRALIFIRAHDPRIGLMCFIGVGIVEVSSCEIMVAKGQEVKKGQEIGTFHFGGSTHCLVFGPETKLDFVVQVGELIPVHQAIAHVRKPNCPDRSVSQYERLSHQCYIC